MKSLLQQSTPKPAAPKTPPEIAVYDLSKNPTTFDFVTWAVLAKSSGCDHVHFIADQGIAVHKYPATVAWKRFGTIVIPACPLAGLTFSVGGAKQGRTFRWNYGNVEQFYRKNGFIKKLAPTGKIPKKNYVTLTIRESIRNKWRDSNKKAWIKFGKYLEAQGKNVMILQECEMAPLDLGYRMAAYSQAEMNYGASNGPFALCHFSDAPYITMNICPSNPEGEGYDMVHHLAKTGFPVGSQFSFRNKKQKLYYVEDSYENIIRAHEEMSAVIAGG